MDAALGLDRIAVILILVQIWDVTIGRRTVREIAVEFGSSFETT